MTGAWIEGFILPLKSICRTRIDDDARGITQASAHVDQVDFRHMRRALDSALLCSNDPVCAQHTAKQLLEERFLLGAACHGCLLISETSCERFNQYLDRSLVVATVGATGAQFFTDQDLALP